jgi:uncharacterized MAPEG superfamily protein
MSTFIAPHSITALIVYALWTIALALAVAAARVQLVARGKAKLESFTPGAPHGGALYWRLNRAHINATENLAIFASVVLCGWVVGLETVTFNELAVVVIAARIVQTLIHIASGAAWAINSRFLAFAVQIGCEIWMAVLILKVGGVF